jgi:imidazolonepropionase
MSASALTPFDRIIRNASEVVTCTGPHPGPALAAIDRRPDAVVGIKDGRIAYVGPESALPLAGLSTRTETVDADGGFVGPGFVDAHTHLVFAGERADEFALRCAGATYAEIAASGGGITRTVRATRDASDAALLEGALGRLKRLLAFGVTTAEVKSGYGLEVEAELRLLRVIRQLSSRQPISLVPTLLCAHAIPEAYRDRRKSYVDLCVEAILPVVAEQKLARFCDAFVDASAFTQDEARRVLEAAKSLGLGIRVHADQLNTLGGTALAVELGAASADHLEAIAPDQIAALAHAGVAATLLPTSTLFLRLPRYAPGRALWDAGAVVALGTNVNPGSAMSENHALTLGLACLGNGLTPLEAYWAATRGSARALQLPDAGHLAIGAPADLVCFDVSAPEQLPYRLGINSVRWVIKDGRTVL